MRTFILASLITTLFVSLAFSQAKPKVEWKSDDLAKAGGYSQLAQDADKALTSVDAATRIGIVIDAGTTGRTTIVVVPTDSEWASVVTAVKAIAAKRKAAATTALDGLGVTVTP